jgi:hypothetical protein
MEKINIYKGMLLLMMLTAFGCKEFFEPSIDKDTVTLLAPVNGTETAQYAQTFWWTEVEHALKYRLQVVAPDFVNTSKLVLDTVVATDKFTFSLDPGKYEWRVRAQNGSSQTLYTTAAFTVYASSIKQQQPQLESPLNNTVTNVNSATFKWSKLYGATKYQLEVDTNNFADEATLFYNNTVTTLSYNVPFTRDKLYQWRVKALNDTAESKWSTVQNITFDSTPPTAPTLVSPASGLITSSPVALRWNAVANATRYKLFVYKGDQTTLYSSAFPVTVTGTNYTFTGVAGEKLYWELQAIDAVGNIGEFSAFWNFTLQ